MSNHKHIYIHIYVYTYIIILTYICTHTYWGAVEGNREEFTSRFRDTGNVFILKLIGGSWVFILPLSFIAYMCHIFFSCIKYHTLIHLLFKKGNKLRKSFN